MTKFIYRLLAPCFLLAASFSGTAEILDDSLDRDDYMQFVFTPLYQRTLNAGDESSNYELDFLGLKTVRQSAGTIGNTRIAWWGLRNETIGNTPAGELASDAGLLWNTNDGDAPEASNFLGVLVVEQYFKNDALKISAGKVFPGNDVAVSDYAGDDRSTFMSEIIASDIAGQYFNATGLGGVVTYEQPAWFITGVVSDATAEDEFIDVSTFKDGNFLYAAEAGFTPNLQQGSLVATVMPYTVDSNEQLKRETGVVLAYTFEYGDNAEFASFGRYTWRDGGEGRTESDNAEALKTDMAGHIGWAWNRAFGRENQQLGTALMYASPTDYQRRQGLSTQYGVESFWRVSVTPWFSITPNIQLLRNSEDELETVVGLRLKLQYSM